MPDTTGLFRTPDTCEVALAGAEARVLVPADPNRARYPDLAIRRERRFNLGTFEAVPRTILDDLRVRGFLVD